MLRFSICFAFSILWEMSRKTLQKKSSWMINVLLDVLVYSITVFLHVVIFLPGLQACQNMAQLVKMLSNTTHQNI